MCCSGGSFPLASGRSPVVLRDAAELTYNPRCFPFTGAAGLHIRVTAECLHG